MARRYGKKVADPKKKSKRAAMGAFRSAHHKQAEAERKAAEPKESKDKKKKGKE